MPKKIYEISVTVAVRSVDCPGVWLCRDGQISLFVTALGSTRHTARLEPRFPINFNEIFRFDKIFHDVDSLDGLRAALVGEVLQCELVHWPRGCSCEGGSVLATYCGDLPCVLFPPEVCAKSTVQLLMLTHAHFPGILSPMIKLSTKTRIEEVYACEVRGAARPRHICSDITRGRSVNKQMAVCHSGVYHNNCHKKGPISISLLKNKSYNATTAAPRDRYCPPTQNTGFHHFNNHICQNHEAGRCHICSEYRKTFQYLTLLSNHHEHSNRRSSVSLPESCVDGDAHQNCKINSARRLHNHVISFFKNMS